MNSNHARGIAFLGTGIMGAPMATHLVRGGHRVFVFNRTPGKAAPVVEAGATLCATPREAFQRAAEYSGKTAPILFTNVTDGPDVEAVLFGENGALTNLVSTQESAPPLWVDCSTIAPQMAKELAARAAKIDVRSLDAPVTGGEIGAQNATLSIMVGGAESDLNEARDVLLLLGKTITHCGASGSGQVVKLCNQICGAMNLLGVCEALALAAKNDIAPYTVSQVIGAGAASSWAMQNLAPKIAEGNYAPGFMIDTQQKDLRLVMQLAEESAVPLSGAALAMQLFRAAQAQGCGADGIQAMYKIVAQMAALPQ